MSLGNSLNDLLRCPQATITYLPITMMMKEKGTMALSSSFFIKNSSTDELATYQEHHSAAKNDRKMSGCEMAKSVVRKLEMPLFVVSHGAEL